jgi:enoyl-CoA hydratase/carnithine racemase
MASEVLYEVDGKVATITINRPEKLNALSLAAQFALHDAWVRFREDDRVIVGIVTGAGERSFCAGMDLRRGDGLPPEFEGRSPDEASGSICPREYDLGKPLIAAINGYALGMGAAIVMQCDLRIMSENATIGYPLVRMGMMPGALHDFWMQAPSVIAARALYTGKAITADDAQRAGLVNDVVPLGDLPAAARALADEVAENAPLVIQAIKRTWDTQQEFREVKAWREFNRLSRTVNASADHDEGIRAQVERRSPDWQGR